MDEQEQVLWSQWAHPKENASVSSVIHGEDFVSVYMSVCLLQTFRDLVYFYLTHNLSKYVIIIL